MEVTIIEGVSITVCPFCKTVIHTEGDLRDVIALHFAENKICDTAERRTRLNTQEGSENEQLG